MPRLSRERQSPRPCSQAQADAVQFSYPGYCGCRNVGREFGLNSIRTRCELLYSGPLLELQHIDDAAAVGAIADLAVAVPGLDLEHHALWINLDNARNGANAAADRRCREVADFHVHADAHKTLRQVRSDGGARRHFHMQDHHWRGVDWWHVRHEMTDRHLGGHGHGLLRRHADRDVIARIHICLVRDPLAPFLVPPVAVLKGSDASSAIYDLGITPGLLSGHFAIV